MRYRYPLVMPALFLFNTDAPSYFFVCDWPCEKKKSFVSPPSSLREDIPKRSRMKARGRQDMRFSVFEANREKYRGKKGQETY